ncbi:MAG TPA: hypothetical protein ENH10_08190 [Bacteroidetes bacterium]|nr:hypothetical protein BMS3Bbin04_00639 [bacterium BMS3Bbin04]HDO65992.1 hypothetical protein [Bacteroidota bacterium]HEX05117.1 hypothetical protein [Bacteroidota bacterium]
MKNHILLMILVMTLMAGLMGCSLNTPAPPPYPVQIIQLRDSLAASEEYWPGFEVSTIPLIVYYHDQTWLMSRPAPTDEWKAVEGIGDAYTIDGRYPQLEENSNINLAGSLTTTLLIQDTDSDSLRGHAALAISQAFRGHSHEHYPQWEPYEENLFLYPVTDKALLKWQMLEGKGLKGALKAMADGEKDEVLKWMSYAVAARDSFNTQAPEFAYEYVRQTELQEGLPYYIEVKARNLDPLMMYHNTMWFDPKDTRRRAQVTGAAIAFLLDEYFPEWKATLSRRAADNPDMNDLLRSAVNRSGGLLAQLPADLISEYNQRAGARIRRFKTLRDNMLYEWDKEEGYRIILDATMYPMIAIGFDLYNIRHLEDNKLFHDHWLKLTNNHGVVEIQDQPMMTWPAGDHPLYTGIERLEITGLSYPPELEEKGDSLILRWTGGEMRLINALLEEMDGTISVKLEMPVQ